MQPATVIITRAAASLIKSCISCLDERAEACVLNADTVLKDGIVTTVRRDFFMTIPSILVIDALAKVGDESLHIISHDMQKIVSGMTSVCI